VVAVVIRQRVELKFNLHLVSGAAVAAAVVMFRVAGLCMGLAAAAVLKLRAVVLVGLQAAEEVRLNRLRQHWLI
jgi:hypothetical protein